MITLVFLVSLPQGQSPSILITMEIKLTRSAVGKSEWRVSFNLLNGTYKEEENQDSYLEGKDNVKLVVCPREPS